ncbi:NAD(P)/FAD-dependent oxidoreductase [Paenibacillus sp. LHD-117]|uniref:NAD(P)/FAD-dependent oxidoreductase n=1 Tax=Paenibacillus sp. LHD-117 TaxID=3071412 RepID=UPI0027E13E49|nr:NAD(P)/FAD-dependent oxidoreductase [Paenibacillus sp. LHD-117]MDQ6418549.1 NAD(P)/FAD-dependent oxidoreductase [Paenibacillus sp. LHD-117]
MIYDCAIVGGGPAGLNAALVLGRARRSVALLDNNKPRNGVTHASHGFITRDGVQPAEFRRIAYEEVLSYPTVRHVPAEVNEIRRTEEGFDLRTSSGDQVLAHRLILAAGLREVLPDIEGLRDFYGKSLFNCPFCDGWELRDQPLVLVSDHPHVFHTAKLLLNWSRDLVVCTNGRDTLAEDQRELLASRGIRIVDTPVSSFAGSDGMLERVHFADGTFIERSGGLIGSALLPNAMFDEALGYQTSDNGGIETNAWGRTTAEGVYAAGDSAYVMPSQLIYAAASGSKAAMAVMADLTDEEWRPL